VNKYVRRCRRKEVPEGFAQWEFVCKVGASAETAEGKPLKDVAAAIDEVAAGGATGVFLEIVALPAQRTGPRS
jgi:hypothetical protein